MPIKIKCNDNEKIDLSDFIECLSKKKLDASNEKSLISIAPDLKKLSNNKLFLAEFIAEGLKNYKHYQEENTYSSQVIMLHPPTPGTNYFVRANIWPSKDDYLTQINGEDAFFYHKPHDHNFNFLTIGYLGSGYWSDYYEYEYSDVIGYPGENVELKFTERTNLSEGKIMLYRAHKDVHNQLPADEYSISINVMENSLINPLLDQYSFDIEKGKIKSIINNNGTKSLFDISVIMGDENSMDIVEHIAKNHIVDRIRLNAIHAIGKSYNSINELLSYYNKNLKTPSKFIQKNIAIKIKELEKLLWNSQD